MVESVRKILVWAKHPTFLRLLKFGVVGASGVLVNMGVFWLGTAVVFAALDESPRNVCAGVLAVAVSILTNFLLNDAWTWRDRRSAGGRTWWGRLFRYVLVAAIAGVVQVGVLWVLSIPLGIHELIANFVGIGAGVAINFVVNNVWTFRGDDGTKDAPVGGAVVSTEPTGTLEPIEAERRGRRGTE